MAHDSTRKRLSKFVPGTAWFFIVALLVFMPGKDVPKATWLPFPHVDKLVHAGMFFLLTFLYCRGVFKSNIDPHSKRRWCIIISILAILWGILVEFIQMNYVSGRSFEVADILADSAGVILGLLLSLFLTNRSR